MFCRPCFAFLICLYFGVLGQALLGQGFVNVAPSMGIEVTNNTGLYGSGLSLYDYDGDGWDDLTLGVNGTGIRVYRNQEGVLVPQPQLHQAMTHNPKAVQWVDVDENGRLDLFVVQDGGPTRIFEQLPTGVLMEQTSIAGLPIDGHLLSCAAWADIDGDGDLDVYIGAYAGNISPGDPVPTETNLLFRNEGGFHFTDITESAGVSNGIGLTLAVLFLDVDEDGDPDLLVANDKTFPNALYLNDGNGVFEDASEAWGFDMVIDAMTLSETDFNHDGLRDILITNTVNGQGLENMVYSLVPFAPALEVSESYFGEQLHDHYMWGGVWFDMDNDGDRDLFIAEHDLDSPFHPNPLFVNAGEAGNYEMTWAPESVFPVDLTNAHVAVQGDWDGNGWPDLAVHNVGNHKLRLWRNMMSGTYPNHHWIKVEPAGVVSNSMGIGAWIEVFWDHPESPYRAYTYCGQDFLGQTSRKHHVGLGTATAVDSVRITWPSGVVDVITDPDIDGTLVVEEGESWLSQVGLTAPAGLCPDASGSMTANLVPGVGVLWPNGLTGPTVPLQGPGTVAFHWVVNGVLFPAAHTVPAFPPATLASQGISPGCHGEADGSWQGTFYQGGAVVPPLELESWACQMNGLPWDGHSPVSGLYAGNIEVQWTDGYGCSGSATWTLTQPQPLLVNWDEWGFSCSSDTVWNTASPTGGTPPYSLALSEGAWAQSAGNDTWNISTSLPVGTGIWTDANGCVLEETWEAPWFPELVAEVWSLEDEAGNVASLHFLASGGAPPIIWDGFYHPYAPPLATNDFQLPDWNGEVLSSPAWGYYLFRAQDERGCVELFSLSVHLGGVTIHPGGSESPMAMAPHGSGTGTFRVGPNPTRDRCHVQTPVPVACRLLGVGGGLVREIPASTSPVVEVSDLPAGLYCLQCAATDRFSNFAFRTTLVVE